MRKEKRPPMTYKGYLGTYRYDKSIGLYHGEATGIEDVVTFQATKEEDMEKAFRDSVDDYLAFCEAIKREKEEPEKIPYEKALKQIKKLRS